MSKRVIIIATFLALILTACSSESKSTPVVIEDIIEETSTATVIPTVTAVEEAPSVIEPATLTPISQITKEPTSTSIPVTPTPTVPPAPHQNVDQAPYEISECSDKYPCNDDVTAWENRLRVPDGFSGSYFTRVDDTPTSLTFGPDNLLYVAGYSGIIYTIDENGEVDEYVSGLTVPTGIAFEPGTQKLFVSSRITNTNFDGEGQVSVIEKGNIRELFDGLPCCYVGMHGPNGIAFGPDGYGYLGVGGRGDHGELLGVENQSVKDALHPYEASILRFSPDGGDIEVYARGFRNPYDIAWDAEGNLYATENGRDPDPETGESPPDEVHLVIQGGEHGYPYYECSVCLGIPEDINIVPPLIELIPHAAVTGITAYDYEGNPEYYNDLFIVLWSAFEGAQKVVRYSPDTGEISDFATGFALPIDVTVGPDGTLYAVDYATGIIFKISQDD